MFATPLLAAITRNQARKSYGAPEYWNNLCWFGEISFPKIELTSTLRWRRLLTCSVFFIFRDDFHWSVWQILFEMVWPFVLISVVIDVSPQPTQKLPAQGLVIPPPTPLPVDRRADPPFIHGSTGFMTSSPFRDDLAGWQMRMSLSLVVASQQRLILILLPLCS